MGMQGPAPKYSNLAEFSPLRLAVALLMLLIFSNNLVNLNLVKIMAWLETQGARSKIERFSRIFTRGRDFYR